MMSATPPAHLPELSALNPLSLSPSAVPKDEQLDEIIVGDADDCSSSLSEIEDRGVTERLDIPLPVNSSDGGDTEAETERLEDSPEKTRVLQNVVLTAATDIHGNGETKADTVSTVGHGQNREVEQVLQTSDISSLEDSSDDARMSPTSTARKRKRPLYTPSPQPSLDIPTKTLGYVVSEKAIETKDQDRLSSAEIDRDEVQPVQHQGTPVDDQDLSEAAASKLSPHKKLKGKRKADNFGDDLVDDAARLATEVNAILEPQPTIEVAYNNGEDVSMEDPADGAEVETNMKNAEGLVKKKTALNALGAIEQCFASLKEKLYDERIARCDAELAMLDSATPTHPELLAALEVIDRHRNEKIQYEDNLIKYKLGALQRKSIAEKAQAHAQYMLRVQDIRETHLAHLNQHFYQIQHERRTTDTTAQDYMYHFQPKRSDQIRRQAAYNKEVSLLSGIAKHVGFPAAPEMKGLKQNEIDEDLRAMGITMQPAPVAPLQQAIPRPSLPLSASFSRQKSSTDERFLEQNPWANPQHPAHGHLQRQRSAMSRPESPVITPAPQKRVIDLTAQQGSASTIAEPSSAQNSSAFPTPATGEEEPTAKSRNHVSKLHSTPIKAPKTVVLDDHDVPPKGTNLDNTKPPSTTLKQPQTNSLHRNPSPKASTPLNGSSLSNPLSIPDGPVSFSVSPIPRFSTPRVKVEERPTHSLLGHHALSVGTGPNGTGARFGGIV